MRHGNGEKQRSIQAHCAPNPQRKTRNLPSGVANSVTERKFLWTGGTTTDYMTPEINTFQYAREINASNTKGYEAYLIPNG